MCNPHGAAARASPLSLPLPPPPALAMAAAGENVIACFIVAFYVLLPFGEIAYVILMGVTGTRHRSRDALRTFDISRPSAFSRLIIPVREVSALLKFFVASVGARRTATGRVCDIRTGIPVRACVRGLNGESDSSDSRVCFGHVCYFWPPFCSSFS